MGKRIELPFTYRPPSKKASRQLEAAAEQVSHAIDQGTQTIPGVVELQKRFMQRREKKAAQMRRYRARKQEGK